MGIGMTEPDLEQKVLNWLTKSGHPLEIRVADEFRKASFGVCEGEFVQDGVGESPREIDVAASIDWTPGTRVRIEHVIECKSSVEKPWIVLTSKHKALRPSATIAQTIASRRGLTARRNYARTHGISEIEDLSLYRRQLRSGYAVQTAFRKNGAICEVYSAVKQVVSAAVATKNEYDRDPGPDWFVMIFPVLVTAAPLFEAYYDYDAEQLKVERVLEARLYWLGHRDWRMHAVVSIVSADHIEAFAADRRKASRSLLKWLRAASEVVDSVGSAQGTDPDDRGGS